MFIFPDKFSKQGIYLSKKFLRQDNYVEDIIIVASKSSLSSCLFQPTIQGNLLQIFPTCLKRMSNGVKFLCICVFTGVVTWTPRYLNVETTVIWDAEVGRLVTRGSTGKRTDLPNLL